MGDIGAFMQGHSSRTQSEADYGKGVREVMTDFWREHSQEASLEEMMLDSNAQELTKHELPEILSYLPRFTAKLAATAKHVTAIDFMEKFINKNQETNGHIPNIDFRCEDVTKLRLENNSCDLVFSNWLMMYLEDEEVHSLINKELSWIREGGYLFARESCFGQSGNKKRSVNPTKYRDPSLYMAMFTMITIPTENEDEVFGFELVLSRSLTSYIKMKHNPNQVVWLLQKLRRKASTINNGYKTFQEFLDNQQYSLNGILRYEKIFGRTFVSTGGIDTTKDFVSRLDLQPGQVVLDIGCGIGGSAFYMVKEFGVKVVAIDLSANMINIGMDRAREMDINEDEVQFEIADATKREYEPNTFDVIYSRDTILHIPDKLALFKHDGDHSDQFKDYVKQRGYNLLSPARYGKGE
ncbi:PEAMT-like protein [Mya arenaria]|uniref:phosphoethanolamine N-methyltransferase n=1 Tax=Mya arenaria TaxID=6604 RepID=A0ABY7ERA3_MYAAR|nr:PEAMT-like protein [Mya arenaria]